MSIGPRFAIWAKAPAEWNRAGLHLEHQLILKSESNEVWLVETFSRSFREQILMRTEYQWIYIAQILREDAEILYAFENVLDRALFIELRDLDGIGPKTAALALAGLSKENLLEILRAKDSSSRFKVSGLGPKTLEKLSVGLRAHEERFLALLLTAAPQSISPQGSRRMPPSALLQSMEKLGLRSADTLEIYQELMHENPELEKSDPSHIVRALLQRWGQRRGHLGVNL